MDTQDIESLKKTNAELLLALRQVAAEVTPGVRPHSADSYLPPHIVDQVQAAIAGTAPAANAAVQATDAQQLAYRLHQHAFAELGYTEDEFFASDDYGFFLNIAKGALAMLRPAAADAGRLMDAIRGNIPLVEPVYIGKALRAGREAKPCLSGGTGPVACVMLCNIQLVPWTHTEATAKAFADGYNRGSGDLRAALLEVAEQHRAPATSAAALEPEGWRAFIENCSRCGGGMVSGNKLAIAAKELLADRAAAKGAAGLEGGA